jgi:anti-sigma regulatory factor (Ser/Thr protein kinase)
MTGDVPLDRPFDPGALVELRQVVQAHVREAGMPEERMMDVVLAVHELVANAIRHGAGKGRLQIWQAAGSLRCQVDDDGATAPIDPSLPWPVRRGHGLWVVRQVADHVEILSGPGGTRATITFNLAAGPATAPV